MEFMFFLGSIALIGIMVGMYFLHMENIEKKKSSHKLM